jgi:hypothetical protein
MKTIIVICICSLALICGCATEADPSGKALSYDEIRKLDQENREMMIRLNTELNELEGQRTLFSRQYPQIETNFVEIRWQRSRDVQELGAKLRRYLDDLGQEEKLYDVMRVGDRFENKSPK